MLVRYSDSYLLTYQSGSYWNIGILLEVPTSEKTYVRWLQAKHGRGKLPSGEKYRCVHILQRYGSRFKF